MVLQIADDPPSLYLDCTRHFTSIIAHTAHLRHHMGITLQVVPKTKYTLGLLVDNEERELQWINNQTWEPANTMAGLISPGFVTPLDPQQYTSPPFTNIYSTGFEPTLPPWNSPGLKPTKDTVLMKWLTFMQKKAASPETLCTSICSTRCPAGST